jgi:regulatory protein
MKRSKTGRSRDLFRASPVDAAVDEDSLSDEARAELAKNREKEIEIVAVRLLTRREHSTEELRRKLTQRGYPAATIAAVLDKLGTKKVVSDERFTSSFVRHNAGRGQGPVRIRAALRQQGITDSQIQQEVGAAEVDWKQRANEVRRRKFGAELPRTQGERAKQARFLQYRGFNSDQIRAALNFDPDMDVAPEGGSGPDHS